MLTAHAPSQAHLQDPDKILFTYSHILPNFLNKAVGLEVEA
jgi:hypothetical protein